jgi:hypothetical protein
MMTCESSTTLRSMRTPILLGVEMDVCASANNKVHNDIKEAGCARTMMKPSNRSRDIGFGKLADGASSQREATESGRVAEYAAH